ncbi:MAG: MSCRAMM family protein, partial [Planctomycetota bacterium]
LRAWASPGRYRITARHPDYSPHSFDLEVTDGGYLEPLEIMLAPGGSLRIRVVGAQEKPKPGVRIVLAGQDDVRGTSSEGVTDEGGVLIVTQLPPGRYEVKRPGPDPRTKGETRFVTVVPGEEVEVLFIASCILKGKVIGPSRYPLKSAIVRLWPKSTGKRHFRMSQARTDGKGKYLFDGLEPGTYELTIQVVGKKDNYSVSVGMVELEEGDEVERDVTVEPSKLTGRITRSDTGEPLSRSQVQISCWPAEVKDGEFVRNTGKLSMAFANKEGRFSFVGLQPGWYRIWIASHSPSFGNEWRLVDFRGGEMDNVDFALEPRRVGKLRLTGLEPEGEAASGLNFSVKTSEEGSRTLHGQRVSDGVYEFPMEVGEQVVYASRKGFYATVEVTIEEGQTVQATAQLERPQGR